MVIFKIENMDENKPVPVVNLPTVRFIGAPPKQGIIDTIQGERDPDRSVSLVTSVGVPV